MPTTTAAPRSRSADDRLLEVAHRLADRHPVGDVVAADDDDRDVGAVRRRQPGQLVGQHRGLRADPGGGGEAHGAAASPWPAAWPAGRRASPWAGRPRDRPRSSRRGAAARAGRRTSSCSGRPRPGATSPSGLPTTRRAAVGLAGAGARGRRTAGRRRRPAQRRRRSRRARRTRSRDRVIRLFNQADLNGPRRTRVRAVSISRALARHPGDRLTLTIERNHHDRVRRAAAGQREHLGGRHRGAEAPRCTPSTASSPACSPSAATR